MKSIGIFIQRMFFWFFTYVAAFFGGMMFMQHLHDEAEKETEKELTYSDLIREVDEVIPTAVYSEDNQGQIVIYTGLTNGDETLSPFDPDAETEDPMHLTRDFNAETSKNWSPDMAINQLFLRQVESYANEILRRRGHVFLNEIYDEVGLKRTSHGAIAGWLFRDNVLIAFVPREPEPKPDDTNITLEFDYDGVIYNRLVIL